MRLNWIGRLVRAAAIFCCVAAQSASAQQADDIAASEAELEAALVRLGYADRNEGAAPDVDVETALLGVQKRLGQPYVDGLNASERNKLVELITGLNDADAFPCPEKPGGRRRVEERLVDADVIFYGPRPEEYLAVFYERIAACRPELLRPKLAGTGFSVTPTSAPDDDVPAMPIRRTAASVNAFNDLTEKLGAYLAPRRAGSARAVPTLPVSVSATRPRVLLSEAPTTDLPATAPDSNAMAKICREWGYLRDASCVDGKSVKPLKRVRNAFASSYVAELEHFELRLTLNGDPQFLNVAINDALDHVRSRFEVMQNRGDAYRATIEYSSSISAPLSGQKNEAAGDSKPVQKELKCSPDECGGKSVGDWFQEWRQQKTAALKAIEWVSFDDESKIWGTDEVDTEPTVHAPDPSRSEAEEFQRWRDGQLRAPDPGFHHLMNRTVDPNDKNSVRWRTEWQERYCAMLSELNDNVAAKRCNARLSELKCIAKAKNQPDLDACAVPESLGVEDDIRSIAALLESQGGVASVYSEELSVDPNSDDIGHGISVVSLLDGSAASERSLVDGMTFRPISLLSADDTTHVVHGSSEEWLRRVSALFRTSSQSRAGVDGSWISQKFPEAILSLSFSEPHGVDECFADDSSGYKQLIQWQKSFFANSIGSVDAYPPLTIIAARYDPAIEYCNCDTEPFSLGCMTDQPFAIGVMAAAVDEDGVFDLVTPSGRGLKPNKSVFEWHFRSNTTGSRFYPPLDGSYLIAPGSDIVSIELREDAANDELLPFGFARRTGSSMATPFVSALAARALARHRSFFLSRYKLKAWLLATATPLPGLTDKPQVFGAPSFQRALLSRPNYVNVWTKTRSDDCLGTVCSDGQEPRCSLGKGGIRICPFNTLSMRGDAILVDKKFLGDVRDITGVNPDKLNGEDNPNRPSFPHPISISRVGGDERFSMIIQRWDTNDGRVQPGRPFYRKHEFKEPESCTLRAEANKKVPCIFIRVSKGMETCWRPVAFDDFDGASVTSIVAIEPRHWRSADVTSKTKIDGDQTTYGICQGF